MMRDGSAGREVTLKSGNPSGSGHLGHGDLLATMPTAAKYKNICEAVDGVLHVTVHQLHPRGQGTVDIIVTGTAGGGNAGAACKKVQAVADGIKAPDDDVLVKSALSQ